MNLRTLASIYEWTTIPNDLIGTVNEYCNRSVHERYVQGIWFEILKNSSAVQTLIETKEIRELLGISVTNSRNGFYRIQFPNIESDFAYISDTVRTLALDWEWYFVADGSLYQINPYPLGSSLLIDIFSRYVEEQNIEELYEMIQQISSYHKVFHWAINNMYLIDIQSILHDKALIVTTLDGTQITINPMDLTF